MSMASKITASFIAYVSDPFSVVPGLLYLHVNNRIYRIYRETIGGNRLNVLYLGSRVESMEDIEARVKHAPCVSVTYDINEAPFTEETIFSIANSLVKSGDITLEEKTAKWA